MPVIRTETDLEEALNLMWNNASSRDESEILTVLVGFINKQSGHRGHTAIAFTDDEELKDCARRDFGMVDTE